MMQIFRFYYFYGENVNAIYTWMWCTLIVKLLWTVEQKKGKVKTTFSLVYALVRVHLISMLDVFEPLRSESRYYNSKSKAPPEEI